MTKIENGNAEDVYTLFETAFINGKQTQTALAEVRAALLVAKYDLQTIWAFEEAYVQNRTMDKAFIINAFEDVIIDIQSRDSVWGMLEHAL